MDWVTGMCKAPASIPPLQRDNQKTGLQTGKVASAYTAYGLVSGWQEGRWGDKAIRKWTGLTHDQEKQQVRKRPARGSSALCLPASEFRSTRPWSSW